MSDDIDISVVIGFRNWGLRRLQLAVKSIQESFGSINGEVIVSDYGSDDGQVSREGIEAVGARYVYTATDGRWSRSRALNAGFARARGSVLVSTDADMIFSPRSFEVIGKTILTDPTFCLLLQCRDLPESWGDAEVADAGFAWDTFDSVSRLRPRWGMGGMMAVHRDVFSRIRGLDERMHTYGGEDIDFATRAKRAGQRLYWVDHPDVRMYHMWHPPTKQLLEISQDAREAIEFNKGIVYNDKSFVRNTSEWIHRFEGAGPLVSVAIATHNRSGYLFESITSVLGQSMQDFEIVVVDDGSTDNTRKVVEGFEDSRIRYFYQERAGVAAARNRAADESRGAYTAVHDDDDLMTPWRLQTQLDALDTGLHGTFGAFVNFDNASGDMTLFRAKAFSAGTIDETGGAPGHGTWLLETKILQRLRYDESLSSGVDNNLALRMIRSGYRFAHSGEIVMMRRMHPGQITSSDEHTQKLAARQTRQLFSFGTSAWGSAKMKAQRGASDWTKIRFADDLDSLLPFLPDHLVTRRTVSPQLVSRVGSPNELCVSQEHNGLGSLVASKPVSAVELAICTSTGQSLDILTELKAHSMHTGSPRNSDDPADIVNQYLGDVARKLLLETGLKQAVVVTVSGSPDEVREAMGGNDFIETSRGFRYLSKNRTFSFLVDQTGTEWVSWVAFGRIDVRSVTGSAELDFGATVYTTPAQEGIKA